MFEGVREREFRCVSDIVGDRGEGAVGIAELSSGQRHSPPGEVGDGWLAEQGGESPGEGSP